MYLRPFRNQYRDHDFTLISDIIKEYFPIDKPKFIRVLLRSIDYSSQRVKCFSALLSFCLLALILLLGGCHASRQVSDTYLNYEDNETGWSTRYPSSWEMVADHEAASTEGRGQKKLETTVNGKIDMDHTRLLWIRNGPKNSFISNKMVFEFPTAATYNANYKKIYDVVVKTQEREGIKLDYTDSTRIIDGLEFKTFEMTIYSKTGRAAGHQLVCTRYINGRIGLLLNINYTNEVDKQILMNVLTSGKLKIRN